jgi:hypothetical protein
MTKGVNLPRRSWCYIEFLKEPSVTKGGVVDHISESRGRFIMHAPPAINHF